MLIRTDSTYNFNTQITAISPSMYDRPRKLLIYCVLKVISYEHYEMHTTFSEQLLLTTDVARLHTGQ